MSKKCTPLWREAHFDVKSVKDWRGRLRCWNSARHCGAKHISKSTVLKTDGVGWDVQKAYAVLARSTFRSQNVQNTPCAEQFWKLRCSKSVHRCGAKHISKSKCTKRHMFAPLLDVEASFWVAGARDFAPCQKWAKREGFVAFPKTMAGVRHLKRICKDGFRVAGAVQETCSSEMLRGQAAYFLIGVAFWSIRSSGLRRWFCVTGAALCMTWHHLRLLLLRLLQLLLLRLLLLVLLLLLHYYTTLQLQLQLHYFTHTTLHWLHYTTLEYTTRQYTTLQYTTLHYTTLLYNYNYNYTYFTTLHLQLDYNYNYNCTTPHYIRQLWVRWPLQPLQPLLKTQLQPPFGPSVDSLCHPWFTTTNLSYRFPIFETSATVLCGTTGNKWCVFIYIYIHSYIYWCPQLHPSTSWTQCNKASALYVSPSTRYPASINPCTSLC